MFNFTWQRRVVTATPLISLFIFLLIGFTTETWHPTWVIFLLIPLMPFIVGIKKFKVTFALIVLVVYLTLGIAYTYWHPGWLLFLLIPIYHILTAQPPKDSTVSKSKDPDFEMDKNQIH